MIKSLLAPIMQRAPIIIAVLLLLVSSSSALNDYIMDTSWPMDQSIFARLNLVVSSVAVDHNKGEVYIAQKNLESVTHPLTHSHSHCPSIIHH
jgi:hypothetical protein